MRRSETVYSALLIGILLLALAGAVLLYFAQTVGYDFSIRHFARNSPYAIGAAVVLFLGVLLGAALAFLRRKGDTSSFDGNSPVLSFVGAVAGFLLLASFIVGIRALSDGMPLISVVRLVFAALSSVYFFMTALTDDRRGGYALSALAPILYALTSVLDAYFNKNYGMNSPVNVYTILTYLGLALFFVAEARRALGRTNRFTDTLFPVLSLLFTTAVGFSRLLLAFTEPAHGFSVMDGAVLAALAVFAALRLFPTPKTSDEVSADEPTE